MMFVSRSMRPPAAVRGVAAFLAVTAAVAALSPVPAAAQSAVIFMYHRFGEDQHPSTNIRLEQFDAHIAELTSGRYKVLPLPEIVAALKDKKPLPDRAVALTVDDGYRSVYTEAWPRLKKAGLPFTVFVSTEPIDRGFDEMMTWDQVRELKAAGVTIGGHTVSHLHMADTPMARNAEEIEESNARFEAELGAVPTLFAYPYGEASLAVIGIARNSGAIAAFGQQSGVASTVDDMFYLPRFALNESYGDLDRLKMLANALPLLVTDMTPANPAVTKPNPPPIGFTVGREVERLGRLACYMAGEGKLAIERLGEYRMEIRPTRPFDPGRTRLNCTVPTRDNRWRWFGWQFYVAPR